MLALADHVESTVPRATASLPRGMAVDMRLRQGTVSLGREYLCGLRVWAGEWRWVGPGDTEIAAGTLGMDGAGAYAASLVAAVEASFVEE